MKVMVMKIKHYQPIQEYFDEIKLYLKDAIDNLKILDTWKMKFALPINVLSFKESNEKQVIHAKIHNM